MKTILLFALLSVLIAAVLSEGGKWGERKDGDEMVYRRIHEKPASWSFIVTNEVNLYFKGKTITEIYVVDYQGEGSLSIIKGGVDTSEVLLYLQSGRGKKLNFLVEAYAKNKETAE